MSCFILQMLYKLYVKAKFRAKSIKFYVFDFNGGTRIVDVIFQCRIAGGQRCRIVIWQRISIRSLRLWPPGPLLRPAPRPSLCTCIQTCVRESVSDKQPTKREHTQTYSNTKCERQQWVGGKCYVGCVSRVGGGVVVWWSGAVVQWLRLAANGNSFQ